MMDDVYCVDTVYIIDINELMMSMIKRFRISITFFQGLWFSGCCPCTLSDWIGLFMNIGSSDISPTTLFAPYALEIRKLI